MDFNLSIQDVEQFAKNPDASPLLYFFSSTQEVYQYGLSQTSSSLWRSKLKLADRLFALHEPTLTWRKAQINAADDFHVRIAFEGVSFSAFQDSAWYSRNSPLLREQHDSEITKQSMFWRHNLNLSNPWCDFFFQHRWVEAEISQLQLDLVVIKGEEVSLYSPLLSEHLTRSGPRARFSLRGELLPLSLRELLENIPPVCSYASEILQNAGGGEVCLDLLKQNSFADDRFPLLLCLALGNGLQATKNKVDAVALCKELVRRIRPQEVRVAIGPLEMWMLRTQAFSLLEIANTIELLSLNAACALLTQKEDDKEDKVYVWDFMKRACQSIFEHVSDFPLSITCANFVHVLENQGVLTLSRSLEVFAPWLEHIIPLVSSAKDWVNNLVAQSIEMPLKLMSVLSKVELIDIASSSKTKASVLMCCLQSLGDQVPVVLLFQALENHWGTDVESVFHFIDTLKLPLKPQLCQSLFRFSVEQEAWGIVEKLLPSLLQVDESTLSIMLNTSQIDLAIALGDKLRDYAWLESVYQLYPTSICAYFESLTERTERKWLKLYLVHVSKQPKVSFLCRLRASELSCTLTPHETVNLDDLFASISHDHEISLFASFVEEFELFEQCFQTVEKAAVKSSPLVHTWLQTQLDLADVLGSGNFPAHVKKLYLPDDLVTVTIGEGSFVERKGYTRLAADHPKLIVSSSSTLWQVKSQFTSVNPAHVGVLLCRNGFVEEFVPVDSCDNSKLLGDFCTDSLSVSLYQLTEHPVLTVRNGLTVKVKHALTRIFYSFATPWGGMPPGKFCQLVDRCTGKTLLVEHALNLFESLGCGGELELEAFLKMYTKQAQKDSSTVRRDLAQMGFDPCTFHFISSTSFRDQLMKHGLFLYTPSLARERFDLLKRLPSISCQDNAMKSVEYRMYETAREHPRILLDWFPQSCVPVVDADLYRVLVLHTQHEEVSLEFSTQAWFRYLAKELPSLELYSNCARNVGVQAFTDMFSSQEVDFNHVYSVLAQFVHELWFISWMLDAEEASQTISSRASLTAKLAFGALVGNHCSPSLGINLARLAMHCVEILAPLAIECLQKTISFLGEEEEDSKVDSFLQQGIMESLSLVSRRGRGEQLTLGIRPWCALYEENYPSWLAEMLGQMYYQPWLLHTNRTRMRMEVSDPKAIQSPPVLVKTYTVCDACASVHQTVTWKRFRVTYALTASKWEEVVLKHHQFEKVKEECPRCKRFGHIRSREEYLSTTVVPYLPVFFSSTGIRRRLHLPLSSPFLEFGGQLWTVRTIWFKRGENQHVVCMRTRQNSLEWIRLDCTKGRTTVTPCTNDKVLEAIVGDGLVTIQGMCLERHVQGQFNDGYDISRNVQKENYQWRAMQSLWMTPEAVNFCFKRRKNDFFFWGCLLLCACHGCEAEPVWFDYFLSFLIANGSIPLNVNRDWLRHLPLSELSLKLFSSHVVDQQVLWTVLWNTNRFAFCESALPLLVSKECVLHSVLQGNDLLQVKERWKLDQAVVLLNFQDTSALLQRKESLLVSRLATKQEVSPEFVESWPFPEQLIQSAFSWFIDQPETSFDVMLSRIAPLIAINPRVWLQEIQHCRNVDCVAAMTAALGFLLANFSLLLSCEDEDYVALFACETRNWAFAAQFCSCAALLRVFERSFDFAEFSQRCFGVSNLKSDFLSFVLAAMQNDQVPRLIGLWTICLVLNHPSSSFEIASLKRAHHAWVPHFLASIPHACEETEASLALTCLERWMEDHHEDPTSWLRFAHAQFVEESVSEDVQVQVLLLDSFLFFYGGNTRKEPIVISLALKHPVVTQLLPGEWKELARQETTTSTSFSYTWEFYIVEPDVMEEEEQSSGLTIENRDGNRSFSSYKDLSAISFVGGQENTNQHDFDQEEEEDIENAFQISVNDDDIEDKFLYDNDCFDDPSEENAWLERGEDPFAFD